MKALAENPKSHLDIDQLGITAEWLKSKADFILTKDLQKVSLADTRNLDSIKKHFYEKMTNLPLTHRRIRQYFKGRWTDDHAELKITINIKDHSSIEVLSDSQHAFMIPWTIKEENLERQTYDLRLSKAIFGILPEKMVNYDRIKGDLTQLFSQRIWEDDVRGFLSTLGSEKDFGSQLDPIKKEFTILESYQASSHTIDSSREIWEATLTKEEWPKNILIKSTHAVNENGLSLNNFNPISIIDTVNHILSIPWLKKTIHDRSFTKFELAFDHDFPFDLNEYEEEIDNLKRNRNYQWKDFDTPYTEGIIRLSITNSLDGSSRWLIFPDKTAILVNFWGDQVLNWSSKELFHWEKYKTNYSGARISPNGKIMSPR